jgi:hypothetical protein
MGFRRKHLSDSEVLKRNLTTQTGDVKLPQISWSTTKMIIDVNPKKLVKRVVSYPRAKQP